MEKETAKLLNVLRRIARAAGYAQWAKSEPDAVRFCVNQYNKILARLSELEPALQPLFISLADDASAEVTRMAARDVLAYFEADDSEFGWAFGGGWRGFGRGFRHGGHSRRSRVGCVPLSVTCDIS